MIAGAIIERKPATHPIRKQSNSTVKTIVHALSGGPSCLEVAGGIVRLCTIKRKSDRGFGAEGADLKTGEC
jgi:hypothetical protein